ncbi:hypothetical protein ACET3Z_006381 [Daucus carota]
MRSFFSDRWSELAELSLLVKRRSGPPPGSPSLGSGSNPVPVTSDDNQENRFESSTVKLKKSHSDRKLCQKQDEEAELPLHFIRCLVANSDFWVQCNIPDFQN